MKKILVHVHIFYPEMWDELQTCIANIGSYQYDLIVTLVENHQQLQNDIRLFNPKANIQIIDNLGFDVGAFVHVINQVNLDDYDYVIKLHSKRNVPEGARLFKRYDVSGKRWREYLLSFLKEKDNLKHCMDVLESDKQLGMCGHYCLITRDKITSKDDYFAFDAAKEWLKKMQLATDIPNKYVHGTMFIARAALFKPLQKLHLTLQNFDKPDRQNVRSMAHVFERLFGVLITAQNYKIVDCYTSSETIKHIEKEACWKKISHFFYDVRVSKRGKRTIKVCKIPVWSQRIK